MGYTNPMKLCSISGCSNKSMWRGWCNKHSGRFLRTGDPEGSKPRAKPLPKPKMPCSIEDCEKPNNPGGLGLCRNHYMRQWKYGRTDLLPKLSAEERFWSKVTKTETCWLWTADHVKPSGHGIFTVNKRRFMATRWLWEQLNGPIAVGLELDHLCRNPPCVRPDHLEPVTKSENARRAAQDIHVSPMTGHRGCEACKAFFAPDHYGSFRRSIYSQDGLSNKVGDSR